MVLVWKKQCAVVAIASRQPLHLIVLFVQIETI